MTKPFAGTNYFGQLDTNVNISLTNELGYAVQADCTGNPNVVAIQSGVFNTGCSIIRNDILTGNNIYINTGTLANPSWVSTGNVGGVSSLNALTGDVVLAAGSNITLTPSGQTITISSTGSGGVTSVSGTLNRITSTGGTTPVIDIDAGYVGQSSITTVGTITTGTWSATAIAISKGGTGQITANAAFNALIPSQIGNSGLFLTTDGANTSWASVSGGSGTVTTVSVVTSQGVSGSVANPTTTPAITLTLGALTGITSLNGLIITANTGVVTTGTWNATKIGLLYGGTNADLSATGGTSQYLKQASSGAAITVGTIPASDIASGAALTKTNDTNVTLTLGGTPTTALLAATSLTLGWTGTLANTRGGTGLDTSSSTGIAQVASGTWSVSTALANGTTATTQSAGDNTTKVATDAFVTTAIANAIAGVNPAVAVSFATTAASDTSGYTYNNGASGIGATLTGSNNVAFTADGQTATALLQRVLIKNDTQSPSGAFNGVYYVTQLQTAILPPILTRALDYDMPSDINSTGAIPVVNGTANANTSWLLTSNVTAVGTDPLTYVQFSLNPTSIVTLTGIQTLTNKTLTSPILITPTLGVATATSINGNTFTTGTYTLTGVAGKTLTFNKSLTFDGTDSTTMTFPSTSATIARTDAANTFTGVQTFNTPIAASSVATMTATVGGGVPTPPNNTTTFLRGDGTFAAPTSSTVIPFYPGVLASGNFRAGLFTDDSTYFLRVDGNTNNTGVLQLLSGFLDPAAEAYNGLTVQEISASTLAGGTTSAFYGGIIQGGYIYAYYRTNKTSTYVGHIARCLVTADISNVSNWTDLTISGTALPIGTTDGIFFCGYGNGNFWINNATGTALINYSISGTTLTYVGSVTVSGSNYTGTLVNPNGIWATFSSAPVLRRAAFNGTLDGTGCGSNTASQDFTISINNYLYFRTLVAGSVSGFSLLNKFLV